MQQDNSADKKPSLSWSAPAASAKLVAQPSLPIAAVGSPSMAGRYVGIFAAGLVAGVLLFWGYSAATNRSSSPAVATNTQAPVVAGTSADTGSAALEVASPQHAGLSVAIARVEVAAPTWVVVYESRDGVPGNVLGAHLFFESGMGTVTLLRSTTAGAEYFVGTSVDSGDLKYSKAADKPTTAEDGSIEVARFIAN